MPLEDPEAVPVEVSVLGVVALGIVLGVVVVVVVVVSAGMLVPVPVPVPEPVAAVPLWAVDPVEGVDPVIDESVLVVGAEPEVPAAAPEPAGGVPVPIGGCAPGFADGLPELVSPFVPDAAPPVDEVPLPLPLPEVWATDRPTAATNAAAAAADINFEFIKLS